MSQPVAPRARWQPLQCPSRCEKSSEPACRCGVVWAPQPPSDYASGLAERHTIIAPAASALERQRWVERKSAPSVALPAFCDCFSDPTVTPSRRRIGHAAAKTHVTLAGASQLTSVAGSWLTIDDGPSYHRHHRLYVGVCGEGVRVTRVQTIVGRLREPSSRARAARGRPCGVYDDGPPAACSSTKREAALLRATWRGVHCLLVCGLERPDHIAPLSLGDGAGGSSPLVLSAVERSHTPCRTAELAFDSGGAATPHHHRAAQWQQSWSLFEALLAALHCHWQWSAVTLWVL